MGLEGRGPQAGVRSEVRCSGGGDWTSASFGTNSQSSHLIWAPSEGMPRACRAGGEARELAPLRANEGCF